ncbi:putative apyrase 6 [Nymphaea thermarum]|nr:putative apyrase 6 [Nymphaea thermarum]
MRRSVWRAHQTIICTAITEMEPFKFPSRSNPMNFPARFQVLPRVPLANTKPSSPQMTKSSVGIVVSIVLLLVVLFCVLALVVGSQFNVGFRKGKMMGYGIVIDGGSTGTRIHLFEYRNDGRVPVLESISKENFATMRTHPGLSAFEEDPDGAGRSILGLLKFAKERIPKDQWSETEVRLMATAGLRRLELESQERILDECRKVLTLSRFKFKNEWASVITGADEGIYAWVAANYALGTLGGDPHETTGIIELGGASAQVTFVPKDPPPPEFSRVLSFGGVTYRLYSHSLLHIGQNVAYDSVHKLLASRDALQSSESLGEKALNDPCIPRGYRNTLEKLEPSTYAKGVNNDNHVSVQAAGNFSECRSAALMLLQKGHDECLYRHCNVGSTFIPHLHGRFIATENFFYTSKFFGLAPSGLLSDLMLAGENFCGGDWSELKKKYDTVNEEDLVKYCFSSAYIVALLHDSLGVPLDEKRVGFANEVGKIPLEWALGAFIMQMKDNQTPPSNWIFADESLTLFTILAVAAALIITAWSVSKWRKPQVKTIYDLEKGRYIVTRISR